MSPATKTMANMHFQEKYWRIQKTRLFKCMEKFTTKNWKVSDKKKSDIFHISAQNIDCGHSLEQTSQTH